MREYSYKEAVWIDEEYVRRRDLEPRVVDDSYDAVPVNATGCVTVTVTATVTETVVVAEESLKTASSKCGRKHLGVNSFAQEDH